VTPPSQFGGAVWYGIDRGRSTGWNISPEAAAAALQPGKSGRPRMARVLKA